MTVKPHRKPSRSRQARARCPFCERSVAVAVPSLGTVDVYRSHSTKPGGPRCDNSRMAVRPDEYEVRS